MPHSDFAAQIDDWFSRHAGDGEFVRLPRLDPYALVGPSPGCRHITYSTKPDCLVTTVQRCCPTADVAILGRSGLPYQEHIAWICELAGNRQWRFFGDLDPPDLMVFEWLQTKLRPKPIEHVGIRCLSALRERTIASLSLRLAPSEQMAIRQAARLFLDNLEPQASRCRQLLVEGFKVECEGLLAAMSEESPNLLKSLVYE